MWVNNSSGVNNRMNSWVKLKKNIIRIAASVRRKNEYE